jgi:hypothetical protein
MTQLGQVGQQVAQTLSSGDDTTMRTMLTKHRKRPGRRLDRRPVSELLARAVGAIVPQDGTLVDAIGRLLDGSSTAARAGPCPGPLPSERREIRDSSRFDA